MNVYLHKMIPTNVTVSYQKYDPHDRLQVNIAILYLPGWAIEPSSASVAHLCQHIADTCGAPVYAIQTRPENILEKSLDNESKAIFSWCQKSLQEKHILLASHSLGTVKSIHLAEKFEDKNSSFHLEGFVIATPVGLYKLSTQNLQLQFLAEAVKVLTNAAKESLANSEEKKALQLARNVLSYLKDGFQKEPFSQYQKRLLQQSEELAQTTDEVIAKLEKIKSQMVFILAQKDLISSPFQIRNALYQHKLHRIKLIEIQNMSHGLPYYQNSLIAEEIKKLSQTNISTRIFS